ncbi:hypothetical protein SSYM_1914 [Serratia symbiotica str. Tucson]|uniref:Uncharacterized protein n=2 Tax=Serratia symbiotica TaxID=138074 RepID=E9CNC7_9GAMM|nr:YoaH family protein [Serratia symbiotica]EFW11961.1 hypothetical protein SSYM_1914 [Serratia symbiotica str. Tucson]BBI91270.1 uncharacterized protein SSYIS1_03770 [Serratia symbiotica]
MLSLSHSEQQEAVERIHQLMAQGMGSGEAIACVAQEIRQKNTKVNRSRYCSMMKSPKATGKA